MTPADHHMSVLVTVDTKQAERDLRRLARKVNAVNRRISGRWVRLYAVTLTAINVGLGLWAWVR